MEKLHKLVDPGLTKATAECERLKFLISRCLPAEAVDQILHVRVNEAALKVVVANSAWAARFRFHSRELLQLFATHDIAISQVNIHVLPTNAVPPLIRSSARNHPTAGQQTVSNIYQVAQEIERDETAAKPAAGQAHKGAVVRDTQAENTLGAALRRLAKNLENN